MRRIIREIAVFFKVSSPLPSSDEDVAHEFASWLSVAGKGGKLVLILDGLEQLQQAGASGDPLQWLPLHLPSTLKIYASATGSAATALAARAGGCLTLRSGVVIESPGCELARNLFLLPHHSLQAA